LADGNRTNGKPLVLGETQGERETGRFRAESNPLAGVRASLSERASKQARVHCRSELGLHKEKEKEAEELDWGGEEQRRPAGPAHLAPLVCLCEQAIVSAGNDKSKRESWPRAVIVCSCVCLCV